LGDLADPIVASFIAALLIVVAGLIIVKRDEKLKHLRLQVPEKLNIAFTLIFIVIVSVMYLAPIRVSNSSESFAIYKIALVCSSLAFWGSAMLLLRAHRRRIYWALFLTALFFSVLTVVGFSLFLRNYLRPY
jgi:divalent metal cation (Fe/Co/Zn/Cd) transporter